MAVTTRALITADEFFVHPAAEGPSELVRGEIRLMSPASGCHGLVAAKVLRLLGNHVEERGLGRCFSDSTGYRLPIAGDTEDSVRAPDASVILSAHLPSDEAMTGFLPMAPDLAIEVLSPSDTAATFQEKLDDYLAAGTAALWVLDPARWTVAVHAPDAPVRRLRADDTLDGAPVLPDFQLPVAELFAGLPRPGTARPAGT